MGLKRIILSSMSVRTHLMLILGGTFATGALLSRLLLSFGFKSMEGRFLLVAPVSYLVFFFLVGVWIDYVRSSLAHHAGIDAGEDDRVPIADGNSRKRRGNWFDVFDIFDEYIIIVLCLLFVVVLVAWVLIEGPLVLADAACEALIAAGFARAAKHMLDPDWKGTVLSRTVLPFLFIWLAGTLALTYLDSACPGHTRVSEAIRSCGK